MTTAIETLTQRTAWKNLAVHHKEIRKSSLRELFTKERGRGERLTAVADGVPKEKAGTWRSPRRKADL